MKQINKVKKFVIVRSFEMELYVKILKIYVVPISVKKMRRMKRNLIPKSLKKSKIPLKRN